MSQESIGPWDEALRQGEAVLDRQLEAKTEALRGAESLLRLSLATLGGIIALGGLVVTVDAGDSDALLVGLGIASLPAAAAAFCHAMPFAALPKSPIVILGANLDVIVSALSAMDATRALLVESTVRSVPAWLEANNMVIAKIERWKARGLLLLALAALVLLGTFVYIQGGRIFG